MSFRREFTSPTKRAALKRAAGTCECHRLAGLVPGFTAEGCGCDLGEGNTFYEHIDPDEISKRNDLENSAVLVKTCWRKKTDTYDKRVIAKSKRVRARARGIKRRRGRPMPGSRRSPIKITMHGGPVWRATNQPLRPR